LGLWRDDQHQLTASIGRHFKGFHPDDFLCDRESDELIQRKTFGGCDLSG
jgi:hypothetical protein